MMPPKWANVVFIASSVVSWPPCSVWLEVNAA